MSCGPASPGKMGRVLQWAGFTWAGFSRGLSSPDTYVPVCWRGRVLWAVNCERISRRFCSVSFPSPNQTWSPSDWCIGQKIKVSTLQSYKPTSCSINAYTFMANTSFDRTFLPSICVVIWIYFLCVPVHHDA